jgi:hypothetical protein
MNIHDEPRARRGASVVECAVIAAGYTTRSFVFEPGVVFEYSLAPGGKD